jgi:hypothetical protein
MKMTAANAVSIAIGVGTSKAVGTAFTVRQKALLGGPLTRETMEKASTGTLYSVAQAGEQFGALGQSIIDDVVGSVVGGGVQGVMSAQDPNDAVSALATGVLFAPIGVATGFMRSRGKIAKSQVVGTEAHDVAMMRQLRYAQDKSIKELENNAKALISADDIASAVILGKVATRPDAIGVINNVTSTDAFPLTKVSTISYKRTDGKLDVLFAGPERSLNLAERTHFKQHGTLPPSAKFRQDVNYAGQTFQVISKDGDNVTLRHPVNGNEITVNQNVVSIENVELKPFTEKHFVNKLWDEFYKGMKPDEDFNIQLMNFSAMKGLGDDIRPLATAFGEKLHRIGVESLSPEEFSVYARRQREVKEALEFQSMVDFTRTEASAHRLVIESESRGFYIEDEGGLINVRAIEGNDSMGRFTTTDEALEFVRQSGAEIGGKSLDAGAPVPSEASGMMTPVTAAHSNISAPWKPLEPKAHERWINQFDSRHPNWASAEQYFVGTDGTQGTSTKLQFIRTQDAARYTNARIEEIRTSPQVQAFKKRLDRLSPKQREQVSALRETASLAELEAPGGIARNYELKPGAKSAAMWFHSNAQDYNKALRWLRERNALNMRYQMEAEAVARSSEASMTTPGLADAQVLQIRKDIMSRQSAWQLDPAYQTELAQLKERFGVTPVFEQGANMVDQLFHSPTGSMDVYAGARYYRALVDPDISGLSKADFITRHGLNQDQVMAADQLGMLMDEFGKQFGIDDSRFLTNFLNHYRIYGDPMDLTGLDYYTRGLADGNQRRFASDMVRTGEILNYERDPMRAFDNYIRAGTKSQHLYPALDAADEAIKGELKKIAAKDTRDQLTQRWVEYSSALTGALNLDQRSAASIMMKHLKNLGLDDASVVAKMNESPALNTVLNWVNSSIMGGRVMMALRDTNDAIMKYYTLHGAARTKNFLKKGVTGEQLEQLKRDGIVKSTSFEEMYDPGSLQPSVQNKIGSASHKAAEIGFKLSGQGYTYERIQAAAYLENREFIGKKVLDLSRGLIDKDRAYSDLFINKHDAVVATRFDELVSNQKYEAATHFLAQEEAHLVSGLFGLGNQPQGARTTFGRLYGQLGSYSIANKSFYWKIGMKGTGKEVARTLTRYAMSQSALHLTGLSMGLNLSRWMVTPLSFVFTGGPLLSLAENTVAAGQAVFGTEQQQDYANRQLGRQGWLTVPFGYAIRDVYKAWEMYDTEPNANPFHVGAQALGVPPR